MSQSDPRTLSELREHIQKLTARISSFDDAWDALIIGDGSGGRWDAAIGWCGILIDRATWATRVFFGAASSGVHGCSEILPLLHPLIWYTAPKGPGECRRKKTKSQTLHVALITDCQPIVEASTNFHARRRQREFWRMFDEIESHGYSLRFYHLPRRCMALPRFVDRFSQAVRTAFTRINDSLIPEYLRCNSDASTQTKEIATNGPDHENPVRP